MATRSAGTFDLGRVYRALGVRSTAVQPDLDTKNLIQTIQVADMSKSFAPEAFEARAVGALAGASGPVRVYELKAIAPGGVVIEALRTVGLEVVISSQSTTRMAGGTTVAAGKLDVGGVATTSTVEQDSAAPLAVPPGAKGPIKLVPATGIAVVGEIIFNPVSWFVPPAFFFTVATFSGLIDLEDLDIQWREIPQPQGAA